MCISDIAANRRETAKHQGRKGKKKNQKRAKKENQTETMAKESRYKKGIEKLALSAT